MESCTRILCCSYHKWYFSQGTEGVQQRKGVIQKYSQDSQFPMREVHPWVASNYEARLQLRSTRRRYPEALRRAGELQLRGLLRSTGKSPYSVELCKESSQKNPNGIQNAYSVFSCTSVTAPYENQIWIPFWWLETHHLGQLLPLSLYNACPLKWTCHFGSNIPIITESDAGYSHAEDTMETKLSALGRAWFGSKNHVDNVLQKAGGLPFHFSD